ncbi:hypothetical protein [Actinomadura sp. WMMA1423]|uniref:hypothetical protein n=1 Tax=Actinomadura sp. WMMA1423 TaxID=2591108 RepID=UPI001147992A|nr:hypothetical protein [Actinomadura sp. WMMA1423]
MLRTGRTYRHKRGRGHNRDSALRRLSPWSAAARSCTLALGLLPGAALGESGYGRATAARAIMQFPAPTSGRCSSTDWS